MYAIKTIITPLHYAIKLNKAIDTLNATTPNDQDITNLDAAILRVLADTKKGITYNKLRLAVRGNVHLDRFNRSLTRLIELKYIVMTVYGKYHYHTITLQGRNIVSQLNDHLIAIVNGQ